MSPSTLEPAPPVTLIGNRMYGDGEYAIEFYNVDSFLAPMQADVLTPSGRIYVVEFKLGESRPTVELAGSTIALVRAREARA